VVTLRGDVGSFAEKAAAGRVALRVYGVRAVANDLVVHLARETERTDTDLAQAALAALDWTSTIPNGHISVAVADGWLTLHGAVDWQYQKEAAARAVRDLRGVKGVANVVTVTPRVKAVDVRAKLDAAFKRSAEIDARRINITARHGKVILSGSVHSWPERDAAQRAAWAAPGVRQVEDRMIVVP
jgi:osmotically-inducible protein OsmY